MGRGTGEGQATAVRRSSAAKRAVRRTKKALKGEVSQQAEKAPTLIGSITRTTSKGVEARLDFYRGIQDGGVEGWVVDLVEIHTTNSPAGYLKISYIPPDSLERHYPTAFEWAVRYKGKYAGIKHGFLGKDEKTWRRTDYLKALPLADEWAPSHVERARKEEREALSLPGLAEAWRTRKEEIAAAHEEQYQDFCSYHFNRPVVDFIRIYNEFDQDPYVGGERIDGRAAKVSLQRQGLATLLYETGALWMHQRGLRLHEGLQSPDAKEVWSTLTGRGMVKRSRNKRWDETRRYIDISGLLNDQPELMADFPQE